VGIFDPSAQLLTKQANPDLASVMSLMFSLTPF
jgi:hypothetical protein